MPKVHLVDGTFELFRAYYAPRSKKTGPDGREIGAARQLMRSLIGLLRSPDVTHVAVAFDHVIESFRNEMFGGYKTGEGMDPLLHAQFGLAEEVATALGLVVWPMIEFEADDALATAAHRCAQDDAISQVVICSPDKDLGQCVIGERVILMDRIRKKNLDEAGIKAKFGISPAQIPDYLGLVGDTADGIPGLPRWGAKSTAAVLARYGRIEDIPDSAEDWDIEVRGAKTLAKVLAENRGPAGLYRALATLRTDVPLKEKVKDLKWRGAKKTAVTRLVVDVFDSPKILETVPNWA